MKNSSLRKLVALCLIIGLTSYSIDSVAQVAVPPSKVKNKIDRREAGVHVRNGHLTVWVQDDSLVSVLDRISKASGLMIVTPDSLQAERISVEIKDTPLEEGLRQILIGYDTFFFIEAQGKQQGEKDRKSVVSLKKVWVYKSGQGKDFMPVSSDQLVDRDDVYQKTTDADPVVRAEAVEQLVSRGDVLALSAVQTALEDWDPHVRERALVVAVAGGLILPRYTVLRLLQYDPFPQVRMMALDLVVGGDTDIIGSDIKMAVQIALNDADPQVKEKAQQIWDQLNPVDQPQEQLMIQRD